MSAIISAVEPVAVEEGAKILMQGGNAIDAAVVCAVVQFIVNPQNCGLGGYALASLFLAENENAQHVALDGPALAGSRVTPEMWVNHYLRPNPVGQGFFLRDKVNDVGYGAICTPGTPLVLATLLSKWGTLSWQEALAPAARIAGEGFVMDNVLAMRWKTRAAQPEAASMLDYITSNAEASRIYLRGDGQPYDTGDTIRNPDYGRVLRHLGQAGVEDFYRGELAAKISADLARNGSFVTAHDLGNYQLRPTEPLFGAYRGYTIQTVPAPHGGPTLLAILKILEGYDLTRLEHNSAEYIYLVAMAMKAAFADRNRWLGDPAFVDVPQEWMISDTRAQEWREVIDSGMPILVESLPMGTPDTTQVSVVDGKGNCVSLTHSLGAGSGVISPGLGFMYNNSMVNFHPLPGHPNSIAPGKGRTTGMAPTIIYQDEKPVLILGAPGSTQIITSLVQVILNVIDFGMDIGNAVMAARFDCQGELIRCHMRIPEYTCAEVRARHPITRIPYSHGTFGRVCAITIDPLTRMRRGAADTGTAGMALEVAL
jgi:gamma-glutamyltranspeptidase/glutathione hydrolase